MKEKRSTAILIVTTILTIAFLSIFFCIMAEAKTPRNGKYVDTQGHIYIMSHGKPKTGYFKWHGKWYYGHWTSSKQYPKGSVTVGQFRIKSPGKWYAYGQDGAMIRHDTYVRKGRTQKIKELDIRSRNKTVRYIYGTSRTRLGTRYSTSLMRMQYMDENGKWKTEEGMQYIPDPDWVDMQR